MKVIQEFLDAVNKTEENHITNGTVMFASQVTMESLRVTLASVRDLITDLLSKGARYVLTGKLNQDPLEVSRLFFLFITFMFAHIAFIKKHVFLFSEVFWCDKKLWRG